MDTPNPMLQSPAQIKINRLFEANYGSEDSPPSAPKKVTKNHTSGSLGVPSSGDTAQEQDTPGVSTGETPTEQLNSPEPELRVINMNNFQLQEFLHNKGCSGAVHYPTEQYLR